MKKTPTIPFCLRAVATMAAVFVILLAATPGPAGQTPYIPELPLGLDIDRFVVPKDNPMTEEKIELGKTLFFDKRLSKNNTIACATCHIPGVAFTDGQPVSMGIHRQIG
ncbi:MAG TPA: cytochrome-c peroxidase, partial [Nitrospiria bacterium]